MDLAIQLLAFCHFFHLLRLVQAVNSELQEYWCFLRSFNLLYQYYIKWSLFSWEALTECIASTSHRVSRVVAFVWTAIEDCTANRPWQSGLSIWLYNYIESESDGDGAQLWTTLIVNKQNQCKEQTNQMKASRPCPPTTRTTTTTNVYPITVTTMQSNNNRAVTIANGPCHEYTAPATANRLYIHTLY